jgi:hypothetical protein
MAGRGHFFKPTAAMLHGHPSDLKAGFATQPVTARPNLTIQRNSRQPAGEPTRRGNDISAARPELTAIPIGAAPVQFLTGEPAHHTALAYQVHRQRHLFFVNHVTWRPR